MKWDPSWGPDPDATLRELAADPGYDPPDAKALVQWGRSVLAGNPFDPEATVPPEVDEMLYEGISESMRYAVEYWWGYWIKWCGRTKRNHLPEHGFPERSVATMRCFIWSMWIATNSKGARRGRRGQPYAPATVRHAVYCVSSAMQWLGYASPTRHPSIRAQLRGYAVRWSSHGYKPDRSHRIRRDENLQMARACDLTTVQGLRMATLVRLQHDTGCRESELLNLDLADLSWLQTGPAPVVVLHIRRSKTDQEGEGRWVKVEAVPSIAGDVDPAILLTRWVQEVLLPAGHREGPVFVTVHAGPPRVDGQIAGSIQASRLGRTRYEVLHAELVRRVGLDKDPVTGASRRVTTHGERGGHISDARDAGVSQEVVAMRTGHKKGSAVLAEYYDGGDQTGMTNSGTAIRLAMLREQEQT